MSINIVHAILRAYQNHFLTIRRFKNQHIMSSTKLLCFFIAVFSMTQLNAQLSSGSSSLSGNFTVNSTRFSPKISDELKINKTTTNLTPGFGYFVDNYIFLYGQPIYSKSATNQTFSSEKSESSTLNTGGSFGARFYFSMQKKTNFYLSLDGSIVSNSVISSLRNPDMSRFYIPSIGLGFSSSVNKTVAINASLIYSYTIISEQLSPSRTVSASTDIFGLSVSPENFIGTWGQEEDMNDFTAKGRSTLDGSLVLIYNLGNPNSPAINFDYTFGHFLSRNILLSVGLELSSEASKDMRYGLRPSLRYYFPVAKRLFVYPNVGFNFKNYENLALSHTAQNPRLSYQAGIGGAFFINKHLALEANVLQYNLESDNRNLSFGVDLSLKYFIR